MLFSVDKDRSLSALKVVMALFIIVAPSLFGILDNGLSACVLLLLTGLLFAVRMKTTEQSYVSVCQFVLLTLLFYSIVSILWVSNRNGHYTYISIIASIIMFFSLVADYFCGSNDEKVHRRMMYMISISGIVCAVWNFLYWIIYLVPFGKNDSFSQGLGGNSFLAVFMLLCIILTCRLIKGNSPARKVLFVVSILLMSFTFVMAKSAAAWILLAVLGILYYSTRKSKKFFVPMTLCLAAVFSAVIIIAGNGSDYGAVFKDVFAYGIKNLFGRGGGFWSAKEMFLNNNYANAAMPGLIALLCASSGLVGVLCALAVAGRVVMQFVRLKSWASAINIFITVMIMLLPFAESFIPVFLWMGLIAYNEKDAALVVKRNFDKKTVKYTTAVLAVVGVLTVVLMCQIFIKLSASQKYGDGKYLEAYDLYRAAASINVADGDSCRMAAQALCESGNVKNRYTEAIDLVEKALKRDKYNLENMQTKAQIYYNCEMYHLSAQEYEMISAKVKVNDKYNLETVRSLYNIICTKEKGSSDAKALYEKMVGIAKQTDNLDYKEKINNIVDKALVYTKGELNVENKY